ncbi:MAG: hypothetical protein DRN33_06190 [Thermoplasmata archaeon]|nr:MAG: hypothetical protein DRN33_06190 [Thermoplasmata archaeon]
MNREYKKIEIVCKTPKELSVDEFSRFFYYLNNIYKILIFDEGKYLRFLYLKKVPEEQRLRISIINKSNPLQFELLIPLSISSINIFLGIIKLIKDSYTSKEIISKLEKITEQNKTLIKEVRKLSKLKEIKIVEVNEDKNENKT